jgi:NAD(P)-dependent dehydrogenase (short-subunit alcohol dehydrogenase family)
MSRAVLRHWMERHSGGSILNMASVVAKSPEPKHFATHAYATGKGAVCSLTRALAAYYAPHGIRVNAISPGLVRTPMSLRAQSDPELLQYMESKQPLSRGMMEPEDIARLALFLLSEDSRNITGQIVGIDGGWSVTSI